MTRPSPFDTCLISLEMGILPDDPQGMEILRERIEDRKNGWLKVFDARRAAERNQQIISHHKMMVQKEKR